ncbi:MDR family oxidoreductase [Erwinia sp. QL-Z3]|uniref:acrylyl-CoA reductase (NADPH) n=1 Tax=Erwinia sp. QL-Z3 TaxID=2547962 RepID=UPI0010712467|nr:MDR family oxidoreductase [Erwinia sp. QL-Z3]QBR51805.1 oxidoreductase [Erwinia sp. QL-Z3]
MFKALMVRKDDEGYRACIENLELSAFPAGDVVVDVEYSSLNYKDALAITGRGPILKSFPMVPGIDLAGTVSESDSADFKPGDKVLLTGWGVGESSWGGLAQKAKVASQHLVPLPSSLTTQQAMSIGTAGFTAMLCVEALEACGITPEQGPVLVTGALGGVGSFAISLLAALGYTVEASTGRVEENDWLLKSLGASAVINRDELNAPGKPLQKSRWNAAVDTVGSHTLSNVCASLNYGGAVAACGMAQGMDLPASVAPFILRAVTLKGVDSVRYPAERRAAVWQRLASLLSPEQLAGLAGVCRLDEVAERAVELLDGKVRGRLVVECR